MENININELSNMQIVAHMRKCNYEKFKTLVRMHLSFELDLNTDEFDLPCHEIVYEDKGKLRKWNRLSKKHKHAISAAGVCAGTLKSTAASAGNSPTDCLQQQIDAGFLFHLPELKEYLMLEKNICEEGIFRKTGSMARQNELRLLIQQEKSLNLENAGFSLHDCASVFKSYLQELPEPLLTDAHYPAHEQIAPLCLGVSLSSAPSNNNNKPVSTERLQREQHLLHSVQLLLLLLPEENRQLLHEIMELLHAVACHSKQNKMTPENLALIFAPSLICSRAMPPEALHYIARKLSGIVAYMIVKFAHIFEVPDKLSTDIRAYFLERKRKKTMSPEQTLDESISDISTVNTVYTFVDREKTAAAHNTNTTDTELAQLYAHIQSMPESSKKRRLIKQFNKQNGQGTPLQLVIMNRLKNNDAARGAKSITDSIKKHIFHRGNMTRTPKHAAAATAAVGSETPHCSSGNKNAKLRVLFQSPVTSVVSLATATATSSATSLNTNVRSMRKSLSSNSLVAIRKQTENQQFNMGGIESPSKCQQQQQQQQEKCYVSSSISAPVSRQSSKEITNNATATTPTATVKAPCCSPLKLISDAAKNIMDVVIGERKTFNWDNVVTPTLSVVNEAENVTARYKSEPNLSCMLKDKDSIDVPSTVQEETDGKVYSGKSFQHNLIKGVSMSNLKLFGGTEMNLKRSRRRRASDELAQVNKVVAAKCLANYDLNDLDDETFEDAPEDQLSGSTTDSDCDADELASIHGVALAAAAATTTADMAYNGSNICQQLLLHQSGLYRNLDMMSSTPALQRCRRSMSPITKSAQRMPKAMQESIMTPRSRKPVLLTTTHGSSDQNQTINQTDLSSFREEDEENNSSQIMSSENTTSLGEYADIVRRRQLLQVNSNFEPPTKLNQNGNESFENEGSTSNIKRTTAANKEDLTNDFRKYLLGRSVVSASPIDSSFSSQPDDFVSEHEIDDFDQSQLSPSLLYCLDGNEPNEQQPANESENENETEIEMEMSSNKAMKINNVRKRAASSDENVYAANENNKVKAIKAAYMTKLASKENYKNPKNFMLVKNLILTEGTDETAV